MRPCLIVLAGPNGAGKSTLYQTRVAPTFAGPFINADVVQRDELREVSMAAAYRASAIAAERRHQLLDAGRSFATETVFSHPSKLDIITRARTRDYLIVVMHVGVDAPDLAVARVRARTQEGGHDVPEDKIRERYVRGQSLIRQAVLLADRAMVFDNSRLNEPPRRMLLFANGRLLEAQPLLPHWIRDCYAEELVI